MSRFLLPILFTLVTAAPAQDAQALSESAHQAYDRMEFAKAAQLYMRAVQRDPSRVIDWYNGACSFALSGKKEEAFRCLSEAAGRGFENLNLLKGDSDFASIRSDSRWAKIESKVEATSWATYDLQGMQRFYDGPAIRTPYSPTLTEDERIAGLSKLWSEAKYNFANFNLQPNLDWDGVYREALPEARQAKTTRAYYDVLRRMVARLRDGATAVRPPIEIKSSLGYAPVRTRLIEGHVIVLESSKSSGIGPGAEILEIDGMPVKRYAQTTIRPLINANSAQGVEARLYAKELTEGPIGSRIRLTVAAAHGGTTKVMLPRVAEAEWGKEVGTPSYEFRLLPGNVAYIALNSFLDGSARLRFLNDWNKIAGAEAMVIDVRQLDSGVGLAGLTILSTIIEGQIEPYVWSRTRYSSDDRGSLTMTPSIGATRPDSYSQNVEHHFSKPIALLIGGRTAMAGEFFALGFANAKRGPLVGEPTSGSSPEAGLTVHLPGGFAVDIACIRYAYPDGRAFIGKGVEPTIRAVESQAEFRAGKDAVLEKALSALRGGQAGR
jgi:C-terminal processing protease CtpA/Prc